MRQQALLFTQQPARISLKPVNQGVPVGGKSQVTITLLNADNQPVPSQRDRLLNVSLQFPSGATAAKQIPIKRGESSANFEFAASQAGLTTITVRSDSNDIRADKTQVLVVNHKSVPKRVRRPAGSAPPTGASTIWQSQGRYLAAQRAPQSPPARLVLARWPAPQGPSGRNAGLANNSPRLHISVNDAGSDFLADGADAVIITAYYEGRDGSPAPASIQLWFTNSNGELNPRPLQIAAGAFSGEARLTSHWPTSVHVRYVPSTHSLPAEGDTEFDIHFVPPVRGVALVGPSKLSVVDNVPVMVVFLDGQGNPISTGKGKKVRLYSTQSKLRLAPEIVEIQPDSPVGSAVLFPVKFGQDAVEAVVENYHPMPLKIVVTGWLVLGLCLGGGVAGGLAAYDKFGGSLFWRVFLGILGGAVLCWLYVYLALPKVDINLAHNTFSVFFVAVIGGYLGITVLDIAAGKLGLHPTPGGGNPPPAAAGGGGPAPNH